MNGKILIVEDEFIIAEDLRNILEKGGYEIGGIVPSVNRALEIINLKRPAWVLLDIQLAGKLTGIDLATTLNEMEIPFIYISANSNQRLLEMAKSTKPYGFVVKPFREKDVLIAIEMAIYRFANNLESKLVREIKLQNDVIQILGTSLEWSSKLTLVLAAFFGHITFDYLAAAWEEGGSEKCQIDFVKNTSGNFEVLAEKELSERTGRSIRELTNLKKRDDATAENIYYNGTDFEIMLESHPFRKLISRELDLASLIVIPVFIPGKGKLVYSFYSRDSNAYHNEHLMLLERLQLLLIQVADRLIFGKQGKLTKIYHYTSENNIPAYPEKVSSSQIEEHGLIGSSPAFDHIKKQLSIIAPVDISVLILGESGTGKERVAQSIYRLSSRQTKPLVKVNCAAIPATLMESELFGHEKGAFTGAINRRIGKFEEAIGGTIFLDEIGEMPLDLQVKLLCVLQEKEIVRVGGNKTIKTDVRVIAATNRNLEKEVAEGRFRLDLYYRLNVFPLLLPPLRERKDDILQLSKYFLHTLSKKMGKNVMEISNDVIQTLMDYDWPGNIRELENIIERSVLLTNGRTLTKVDMPEKLSTNTNTQGKDFPVKTFKQMEKDYIFSILNKCNGRIGGPAGAAVLLDLAPTTLLSKIHKLGIVKKIG